MIGMSKKLFNAFLNDTIEFTYDFNYLILQCSGFVDYLTSSSGISCEKYPEYCQNITNVTVSGEGDLLAEGEPNATTCNEWYNMTTVEN